MNEVNHGKRNTYYNICIKLYMMQINLQCQKVGQQFPGQEEGREGQEGEITRGYDATSGSGGFVQSLVYVDGFMENIYTYVFIPKYQIKCFKYEHFSTFLYVLYLNKDDEKKKLEKQFNIFKKHSKLELQLINKLI